MLQISQEAQAQLRKGASEMYQIEITLKETYHSYGCKLVKSEKIIGTYTANFPAYNEDSLRKTIALWVGDWESGLLHYCIWRYGTEREGGLGRAVYSVHKIRVRVQGERNWEGA